MTNQTSDNGTICSAFVISPFEKVSNNLHAIVVMAVFGVVLVVFTSLYNATLIIALCRYTKTCLSDNNITRVLMSSMALVDLLLSLVITPPGISFLLYNGKWVLGLTMFKIWHGCGIYLWSVSANHIFNMAFDKYLAVCQPTRYMTLPNKTAYILTLLSWLVPSVGLSILYGLPGQEATDYDDCFQGYILQYIKQSFFTINFYFAYALFYVPLLLTYILYVLIYLEIRQWSKRAKHCLQMDRTAETTKSDSLKQTILPQAVFSTSYALALFDFANKQENTTRHPNEPKSYLTFRSRRRNLKAIRTIASIVIAFTICWLPYLINGILISHGYSVNMIAFVIGCALTYLNSTLNPLLCLGVKFVRSALKDLLC